MAAHHGALKVTQDQALSSHSHTKVLTEAGCNYDTSATSARAALAYRSRSPSRGPPSRTSSPFRRQISSCSSSSLCTPSKRPRSSGPGSPICTPTRKACRWNEENPPATPPRMPALNLTVEHYRPRSPIGTPTERKPCRWNEENTPAAPRSAFNSTVKQDRPRSPICTPTKRMPCKWNEENPPAAPRMLAFSSTVKQDRPGSPICTPAKRMPCRWNEENHLAAPRSASNSTVKQDRPRLPISTPTKRMPCRWNEANPPAAPPRMPAFNLTIVQKSPKSPICTPTKSMPCRWNEENPPPAPRMPAFCSKVKQDRQLAKTGRINDGNSIPTISIVDDIDGAIAANDLPLLTWALLPSGAGDLLSTATRCQHLGALDMVLRHALPGDLARNGRQALDLALKGCMEKDDLGYQMAELLLQDGVPPDDYAQPDEVVKESPEHTMQKALPPLPLFRATQLQRSAAVELLLAYGANPNQVDVASGQSPLQAVCALSQATTLLGRMPPPLPFSLREPMGKSDGLSDFWLPPPFPFDDANVEGERVAEALLRHGAKPSECGVLGRTPRELLALHETRLRGKLWRAERWHAQRPLQLACASAHHQRAVNGKIGDQRVGTMFECDDLMFSVVTTFL